MQIIPYQAAYLEPVVAFINRMNNISTHHIGYFGTNPVDIEHTLLELTPPLEEGFRLAVEGDQVIGVLGAEIDPEIGRAWLYGPLIDHPNWHALADQLYSEIRTLIPPTVTHYEIFCEAQNLNCQQFAKRHNFPQLGEHIYFVLSRTKLPSIPAYSAAEWDLRFFDQFETLHQQAFPHTYYTAQQIIDKQDEHTSLFIEAPDGELRGYVFSKVDPEAGEGYIDFIAVHEQCRRQGIGRLLLAAAIQWMFSFPAINKVGLTVGTANSAAVRLYDSFGFERESTMCAFRT